KTFTAAVALETGRAVHLRLRSGDEGGQAIDAAGVGNHRLRLGLRLILRLRTMFALFTMLLARLLVAVALERLPIAWVEVLLLVVVRGGDRVAGRACIARQLDVFFSNVRGGTADLDVGSVRFEHPGHRVLTAPVIVIVVIIIVVIPVTHPLVVLTVSHVLPLFQ